MSNIKEALLNYESEEGHNPIGGLLNTLTFMKSLPVYLVVSLSIALSVFIGINILIWGFLPNWVLCLLFSVTSLIGTIYLSFTGFFYFAMTNFIDNLKDIVLGTIDPIEKVYWKYTDKGDLKMTKREFFTKVIKEEIFTSLLDNVLLRRFKGRMSSVFDGVLGNMEGGSNWNEETDSIKLKLEGSFEKVESIATKPYFTALKIWGGFSLLIILLIVI